MHSQFYRSINIQGTLSANESDENFMHEISACHENSILRVTKFYTREINKLNAVFTLYKLN